LLLLQKANPTAFKR